MRQLFWNELKVNMQYLLIDTEYESNKKIGIFQEYVGGPTLRFNKIIHLRGDKINLSGTGDYHIYGCYYMFYELSTFLQEICDYTHTPRKIPSLHTLTKYQLTTEEIRFARMYDGLF